MPIRLFNQRTNSHRATTGTGTDGRSRFARWKWPLTLVVCLAIPVFLETLDYTVVATAQPHIASVFNRLDLQSYIGTLYLLTSTAFLPLFASIADVFGRHFALQISLFVFMLGSAISTGAMNMETMLAGRAIAGVGAAGLLALVRIIVSDSSSLDDNNWQTAIMFLLYTIGYVVGPVLGGVLITVSFRWIFAINLPFCTAAMILALFLLRNKLKSRQQQTVEVSPAAGSNAEAAPDTFVTRLLRIDWIGAFLFIAGGTLVLLALNWGSNEAWNTAKVIASFVVGGLLIVTCLVWEWFIEKQEYSDELDDLDQHKISIFYWSKSNSGSVSRLKSKIFMADPMIPLQIFTSYDVCAVLAATFVSGMVMIVMLYFVAIFMTIVTGLSPTRSGVQLLYFAPGMGGGTYAGVYIIKHTRQPKNAIIFGGLLVPIALGLISMGIQQNKQNLVNGFMVLAGVGIGASISSLVVHARFSQPPHRLAIVAAMVLFFRSLGGTVGLAQCAAVLNAKVRSYLLSAIASGAVSPEDAARLSSVSEQNGSTAGITSVQEIGALPESVQQLVRNAFREGTRWAFISMIPWAAVALILTLFLTNIREPERVPRKDDSEAAVESRGGELEEGDGIELVPSQREQPRTTSAPTS